MMISRIPTFRFMVFSLTLSSFFALCLVGGCAKDEKPPAGQDHDSGIVGGEDVQEGVQEDTGGNGEVPVDAGGTDGGEEADTGNGDEEDAGPQDLQCTDPSDCLDLPWTIRCYGHWSCQDNLCVEQCDAERCGDGTCDSEGGESEASCPEDCASQGSQCDVPRDCLGRVWDVSCMGHWSCDGGSCVEVCDFEGCGDGVCDPDRGEDVATCIVDCAPAGDECQIPSDCIGRVWDVRCMGHWGCDDGRCHEVCDFENCGDGLCDAELGEDSNSCPLDCQDGSECSSPRDCLGRAWPQGLECQGRWECPHEHCVATCDAEGCGDGVCSAENGEDEYSCPTDCELMCVPEGMPKRHLECCDGLDEVVDCATGDICADTLFCVDCGNGTCDPHENRDNCIADCPQGCEVGLRVAYHCLGGGTVPWCSCKEAPCKPICSGTTWFNSCTGDIIELPNLQQERPLPCDDQCTVACKHIGTRSEGWYLTCPGSREPSLIAYDQCEPQWDCLQDPRPNCRGVITE